MALYDTLGRTYAATRRADPRIAAQIGQALAGCGSVVNLGAGTGSYEPAETIAAIEPSQTMIGQRPAGAAPAIRAVAEHVPLRDDCADAALAVLTVHHWTDLTAGIAEMRRIARHRLVLLTWDADVFGERFWLLSEYLPEARAADAALAVPVDRLLSLLADAAITPVPVPHDCADGFAGAFWRRPRAYLDPAVQAGMSVFTKTGHGMVAAGLARLAADLESGRWQREHAALLELTQLDLGYRLITASA
ncbi:MAG TPA: methyltransferase domain-containing protein [Streptosporangiaceae bacterium]|nr:methyltransferase domain-containing protein [Streptosporangiaceae bacterium]